MNLWEYEGMRIKIIDVDGRIFIGYCDHYTSPLDDPDEVGYLSLEPDGRDDILIDFMESEIASIELNPPVASASLACAV